MAEKLSIQIALEGGKEIERQLEGIGKAGEKAFSDIADAAEKSGGFKNVKPEEVTAKLKEAGLAGTEAFNKIQTAVANASRMERVVQGVQGVEKAFAGLATGVAAVGSALVPVAVGMSKFAGVAAGVMSVRRAFGVVGVGIAAAVTGLNELATAAENTIVALGTLAARGGTSIARLDAMRQTFMAAGGSAGEFSKIYERLVGTVDKLRADKVNELSEAMKNMKAAGWGDEAINKWAERQRAIIDRWAPAGKTAADRFAELGKRLADLPTATQRLAVLQREGIAATLENVNALIKYSQTVDQARDKSKDFTQEQLNQAIANQKAVTELGNAWTRLMEVIGTLGMGQTFTNMMTGLVQAFTQGLGFIDAGFQRLPAVASAAWNAILSVAMPVVQTISQAWQGFWMAFNAGLAIIQSAWNAMWQGMSTAATMVFDAVGAAWNGTVAALQSGINAVVGFFTSAWGQIQGAGEAAMAAVSGAINSVIGTISSLIDAIGNAISALANLLGMGGQVGAPEGGGGGGGMARGGMVGGRGSGTSDSNLAWVSRGEHIMPARAVRQPGVLAFLEALRRSGGNLSRVLDGMGRFAMGGLALPAFAEGGLNGMSNVTIQFPGMEAISGLRAPPNVIGELRRAAVMAQVRSGGRKPSRYS